MILTANNGANPSPAVTSSPQVESVLGGYTPPQVPAKGWGGQIWGNSPQAADHGLLTVLALATTETLVNVGGVHVTETWPM